MDEAIRYPIRTVHDGDEMEPCVIAGPTCDRPTCSTRRCPTRCRSRSPSATRGLIEGTGAYTQTYSAVAFNGFAPLGPTSYERAT